MTAQQNAAIINREYASMQGLVSQLLALVQKISLGIQHPGREEWNSKILAAKSVCASNSVLQALKQEVVGLLDARKFSDANTKCWDEQVKLRDISLCYTCSGRSSHFFGADKALISKVTCSAFVKSCGSSLAGMIKLIKVYHLLTRILMSLQHIGIKMNVPEKLRVNLIRYFYSQIQTDGTDIYLASAIKTGNQKLHGEICNKFFRLRDTPIINFFRGLVNSEAPWTINELSIEAFAKEVDAQLRAVSTDPKAKPQSSGASSTASNWSISRLLQFTNEGGAPLGSDSQIVSPSDPAYSSVGVSGNSPMDFGHSFP